MCTLDAFPIPPPRDHVTLCELESRFISGPTDFDLRSYTDKAIPYKTIIISQDVIRPSASRESAKSAFIQRRSTFWKKIYQIWFEQGPGGVLKELASIEQNTTLNKWLGSIALTVLPVYNWFQSWHLTLQPRLTMSKEELLAQFVPALDWHDGTIRAFAWHPNTLKFAVAQGDDTVKVFNSPSNIVPILKHKLQKDIADMAWKPFCASILALACQAGVIIWVLDPTSLVTRPSSTCMTLLSRKGHVGVTSISWHPFSPLLASASPSDSSMLLWDVSREIATPLQRLSGNGVSLVKWSPDGSRLLAATPTTLFRVWETSTWTCEKWSKLSSHCQSCCWSPDGGHLLFATHDEPLIYCLSFQEASQIRPYSVGGARNAIPVADISPYTFNGFESNENCVGGGVQTMIWDKTGERLAVSFRENPSLIAIYRTRLKPNFDISPCGFIRGSIQQVPQLISFHDDFSFGALLSVCWSNGQISHVPMLFMPSQTSSPGLNTSRVNFPSSQNTPNLRRNLFTSP